MTDYEHAQHVAKTHHCPDCEHKARVVVRRDMATKRDYAACGVCGRTEGLVRRESLTARWKRDPEAVPVEIRNKLEAKYGVAPMSEQSIIVADEKAMVSRIEQARWLKELAPQDRTSLAHLSVTYGLDPLMKELTLYEGAPYITVAGMIRVAHRQKTFAGVEDRPMNEDERRLYNYKAPVCWIVKVYRSDWRVPAVGTGTADPGAPFRNNPIERSHPEWMARARAMRQALKLAFPHSLPFDQIENAEERGIDPETGEIIEAARPAMRVVEEAPASVAEPPTADIETPEYGDYTEEGTPHDQSVFEPVTEMRLKCGREIARLGYSPTQVDGHCRKNYGGLGYAELGLDALTTLYERLEKTEKKAS